VTASASLLIDDHAGFAHSVVAAFRSAGMPLDWADSWDRGIDLFRVAAHELVIADYNLPGSEHGLRLLAAVKKLRPTTRLILISGALRKGAAEVVARSTLVDLYMEKMDEQFEDVLLQEAAEAEERAQEATDWPTVASSYLDGEVLTDAEIDEIDAILRERLDAP
jgi:DNA-binding NtrC family response regulator